MAIIILLVNLGCSLIVLLKLFPTEGIGKGILGVIFLPYAFVWGWMKAGRLKLRGVMTVWSISLGLSLILSAGVVQLLNGLVFSMLLFVMAAGLSLIFGQMNVINLTHGAFYLLGGYVGLTMIRQFDNFWLALLLAPLLVGGLGLIIEYLFLRRLYGSQRHLDQVLFTFGAALIAADLIRWYWGAYVESVPAPALLAGQVPIFNIQFPVYRLSLIIFGLILAALLWLFLEQTRLGAIVRAGVHDAQMVSGLGINIHLVFAGVFALGTALAALAGVIGAPVLNLYPGLDFEILILTLVVVVVGGLGTLKGAFFGSLLIGMADTFGKALLPEFALFLIFAVMAVVLLIRPSGLFGLKGV